MARRVAATVALVAVVAVAFTWALRHGDGDAEAGPTKGKPPVVLLMFDEFPTDLLLGPGGKIDAGRYPAFAELARAGYWFPNATTTYDSTTKAIPQIMDGRLPRAGGEPTYRGHPQSVYDLFARRGYEIERMEAATSICPPRYCPDAAPRRPGILAQLQSGRRERFERFLGSIRPRDKPTFWLAHVLLPHGPYLYLPSGKEMRPNWQDPVPGMNSTPGFYSDYLALHAQQRLQLQIGFVDRELGRLLRRMRREGTFDRSLIVVTADHGISSESGVESRRATDMRNIDELAPVPLFVKAPGQRRARAPRSYVRTTDVVPTIADVLGWRLPYRADGRSAFSRAVRKRRAAMVIERGFTGRLHISARALEQRRRVLLRQRLRRFGSGDWDSLYTGIGPNRSLIGRRVADLPRAPGAGPRAIIVGAAAMRAVRPRSRVLPTQVAGSIAGSGASETRDLAVAVNGTIEAVGRSFHLRVEPVEEDRQGESFAVMVSERALRPGRNGVELFEVAGGGGSLRLLGSN
ncbi:MAG TPA: sulfatase-like hydrolase/transferase [Thermoleophilaceae bacterium]|nr:sulfatase-like hydrolase/transferase [Thermoleophilaceae bacterium]